MNGMVDCEVVWMCALHCREPDAMSVVASKVNETLQEQFGGSIGHNTSVSAATRQVLTQPPYLFLQHVSCRGMLDNRSAHACSAEDKGRRSRNTWT